MVLYNANIKILSGVVDGVNKYFNTPTKYVSGSIKVIVNGQIYEPDDDKYGWTESSDQSITFDVAPLTNDVIQAFYQDSESEQISLDNVIGSPFDPNGILP